ncbi:MAG: Peptidase protein [Patescibacteria group bacterium]|nr:Peptidase protein [Patescibacteria group bacterium]
MKKIIFSIFLLNMILPAQAWAAVSLAQAQSGKFVIQSESYNRLWYVDPVENARYVIRNAKGFMDFVQAKATGISNKDIAKIKTTAKGVANAKLTNRFKGQFLLAVESKGEIWYVDPVTGIRTYLKDGQVAYDFFAKKATKLKDKEIAKIPVTKKQIVSSYTFDNVTYAIFEDGVYQGGSYADEILPIASLSKLMTALVLLDHEIDWQKKITITEAHIYYPKIYVGNDATSEVAIKAGQTVSFYDLWVAMLLASSNQSAIALAESTGSSRYDFVAEMNAKAKELGLTKTKFYDVAGLDEGNVSTAREMALIAQAAFSEEEIVEATAKGQYTMSLLNSNGTTSTCAAVNRNTSLMAFGPEAAKSGYLVEAQRTAAVKKGDKIIAILHARSMPERNKILEKYINN